MNTVVKRRDGFEGETLISIPPKIWKEHLFRHPALFQVYITHAGYFPKASFHYRERRKGCDDNILIYCIAGKGHYIVDDQKFEVTPNQFILLPATGQYLRYWADSQDPWTIYWVHFTGPMIQTFNASLNIRPAAGPISIHFNDKALTIWQHIFDGLEIGFSMENLTNANFCLYHLLATFLFPERHRQAADSGQRDMVKETINLMRVNLSGRLNVTELAAQHHLSSSHFSNLFRQATGMPPIDYFIHLKMQRACQLLFVRDVKIKAIAQEVGYDDPYYFSRLFKKFMGVPPAQYRASSNKKAI